MNISGATPIVVRGRTTRVASNRFNVALKKSADGKLDVRDVDGNLIVPSKNLSWADVAQVIRDGKKVQARVERDRSAA